MRRIGFNTYWLVGLLCVAGMAAAEETALDFNNAGVTYYNAGQWDEAIRQFEKAYESSRDNATVRRNLCNAHQAAANELAREADFAAAAKHLELAIGIDPDNYSPLVQLGSYYLRLGFVSEAIARLEEAINLAPQNVDAHDLLGDAYYMDNDTQSARTQWEWVLQVSPDRPGLRTKLDKASREEAVESNFRPSNSRHFQLTYTPETPARALKRVVNILERAYVEIGRQCGSVYPPTPIQVIVYNTREFTDATQVGQHVGALYDGKIRIPLLDESGATLDEAMLRQRLYHEYTHVVVRFLGGDKVPWWLNEGLAETLSRELSSPENAMLTQAKNDGVLFNLTALCEPQMTKLEPGPLRLAYAQAHLTVNYLWKKFNGQRLMTMISDLTQGIDHEEALRRNYNRSYETLQKEVARTIGS